jgi:hypothetical protein
MDLVMLYWGGWREWLGPVCEFAFLALSVGVGWLLRGGE